MTIELFEYQETGAKWLASKERAGLLDEPGAGKSCQTIRALDYRRAKRGIIICPAHLATNWHAEHKKFALMERKLCIGRNIHDLIAWQRGVFDVIVLSFERTVKWAAKIHEHAEFLDFIVIDEFHYLSGLQSARTRAILGMDHDGAGGVTQWGMQVWVLTGTLMPNDPASCFSYLRFTRSVDLPFATFVRKFFNSKSSTWGTRTKAKPAMVEELKRLLAWHSIRRTLAQVGHQLPPIHLTTCLVDGDTQAIRDQLSAHPGLDSAIVEAVEKGGLSFLDAQHIATIRRLIAEAKALPYATMLLDELRSDPTRKVVVMGISREALLTVQRVVSEAGVWCVIVQGGVSETTRFEHVRDFQTNPECRVFVGNIKAAGTGLTLTAAAHIDILESSWVPAENDQAIKRIRRIGQERRQHARFITLARSIDEMVVRVVAEKTKNICQIDGEMMLATAEDA